MLPVLWVPAVCCYRTGFVTLLNKKGADTGPLKIMPGISELRLNCFMLSSGIHTQQDFDPKSNGCDLCTVFFGQGFLADDNKNIFRTLGQS